MPGPGRTWNKSYIYRDLAPDDQIIIRGSPINRLTNFTVYQFVCVIGRLRKNAS